MAPQWSPSLFSRAPLSFGLQSVSTQLHTNYSCMPKLVLERFGNPNGLKFTLHGNDILMLRLG